MAFNFVDFTPIIKKSEVDILKVTERWYVWPYPIFEISERNFNVFWDSLRHSNFQDFSRLNYGVFLNWYNFRGRNELLKIKYRKGYKEHYLFEYDIPYLNQEKHGVQYLKQNFFACKSFTTKQIIINCFTPSKEKTSSKNISFLAFQYKPAIIRTYLELEGSKMSTQYSVENPTFFLHDMLIFNTLSSITTL